MSSLAWTLIQCDWYFIRGENWDTEKTPCDAEAEVGVMQQQLGLPMWLSGKESPCQGRRCRWDPWVRKIPWRRKWQPTPVFLPGKSHGQRSVACCSPWGCRVRHDLVTKQLQLKECQRLTLGLKPGRIKEGFYP